MQNNEQPNWRETLNREWTKDFPTMKVEEIQKVIGLMFYQLFLIDVDRIKITTDIDTGGHYVKFEIEGEAYKDSANLPHNELMNQIDEEE